MEWLSDGGIAATFGAPPEHAPEFERKDPYSVADQLFMWAQHWNNPIVGDYRSRTATYVFKEVTTPTPNPLGNALPWVTDANLDKNLPYLELDLFHPSSVGVNSLTPPPVLFHVHGGAFITLDKSVTALPFEAFQRQGYAVLSIQYRLAPFGWSAWDITEDIVDALLWVRAHAAMLNVDADRMVMMGESAGSFASTYLCYLASAQGAAWSDAHENAPGVAARHLQPAIRSIADAGVVKGCLNMYGVVDVAQYGKESFADHFAAKEVLPTLTQVLLNNRSGTLDEAKLEWRTWLAQQGPAFSCMSFVTNSSPPTFSMHGVLDALVPSSMATSLHALLDVHSVTNHLLLLPMRGHNLDAGEYSVGGQMAWFAFERFLAAVMPVEAIGR